MNSLKEFGLSAKDERKMIVHLAFSLALKYNERVVPMFEDIAKKLRFEAPTSLLIGIMTPDALKKIEYEMLQRLNFRIGEGAQIEETQITRIYEKLSEMIEKKRLFTDSTYLR